MILNATTIKYAAVALAVAIAACLFIILTANNPHALTADDRREEGIKQIHHLVLGSLQTNCYCLRAPSSAGQCLIIDTGANATEPLIDFLRENDLTPAAAIFTHGHHDHINGAKLLRTHFPHLKLLIHKDDANALEALVNRVDRIQKDGPIQFAGIKLKVLHTPGHTPGGICLYCPARKAVFAGDTLFAGSIGRTDLKGGSTKQLLQAIREKLLTLPDETTVYPGHGPPTTIGREKLANPFFR